MFQSRSLAPPTEALFTPSRLEEVKEEKEEVKEEKKQEVKVEKDSPTPLQMNLLATVYRLRRDLHRAEEQRARVRRRKRRRKPLLM